MDFSSHLVSTQLLDCQGRVTHTLTLLSDGTVEVALPSVTAVVDPTRRLVIRPHGFRLPEPLLDSAALLVREAFG
jgi:hypothetical protein